MATVTRQAGSAGSGSRLLRLYPHAWQARYGAEFADLLLARPPSTRDRVDILRGAIDARLNPQLTSEPVLRIPTAADRLIALASVLAGALFTVWASIIALASPRWESMDLVDQGLLANAYAAGMIGMILAVGVLVALAARYANELGPLGAIAAILIAAGFFFAVAGASIVGLILMTGGTLALARPLSRVVHPVIPAVFAVATVLLMLSMLGFVGSEGQTTFWLFWGGGFGPAWILLGVGLRHGRRADLIGTTGGRAGASPSPAGA